MPGPVWLPEVVGDPAGMRALASTLRSTASRIASVDSSISGAVSAMTFEGPAGNRFRDRARGIGRVASNAATTLEGVAAALDRSAAQVEQAQADRLRRLEQMRDDARTGAGGTVSRVLIDPVELRRCGARIKDGATELEMASSGLTCVSLPEMPAGMVGEVSSGIQSVRSSIAGELSEIREAAVELTRRALWAEIADKLASGAELSDSQLREFNAWLMDGSMLRYANSYQAGLAGDFVGAAYRDTFRNPEDLIELAQILRGSQQNSAGEALEAFSAGFVESFGAENMVAVPRVIQAMEWSNVISSGLSPPTDPRVLQDVAQEWFQDGNELEHDPVSDLLAPFSLALANATYSGRLSRTTEEAIAQSDDTWSTAQLVHTGRFGKEFLLDVFEKGVVQRISDDSRYNLIASDPPLGDSFTLGTYGDGDGLPYDTKVLVLDALARNPEAAAAALTTDLSDVKAWDVVGQEHDVTNPIRLLYDFGDFDDDGGASAGPSRRPSDELRSDPGDGASIDRANRLTLDVVDRVLNGENELDGVTDGLARDLGDHHLEALHISATCGAGRRTTTAAAPVISTVSTDQHPPQPPGGRRPARGRSPNGRTPGRRSSPRPRAIRPTRSSPARQERRPATLQLGARSRARSTTC